MYSVITDKDIPITKIKGLSKEITKTGVVSIDKADFLLFKHEHLELSNERWYKKMYDGEITIAEQLYHLKSTSNKRQPVYIQLIDSKSGELKDFYHTTLPYNYKDIEISREELLNSLVDTDDLAE